ncbi:MAG TPA: Fur family transcriptional regulator [Soehngenia sp.]|nr:Fur family transcriptional regulator [Soehngenia sp.]HPP31975.1 Fur family transcriptional regulator [Soehngenia sp.]
MELNVKEILNSKGIKATKQRIYLYELLTNQDKPITAEDIYFIAKNEMDSFNLSTVYRILDIFVKKNLIIKSKLDIDEKFYFEIIREKHRHYLLCIYCNQIIPLSDCPIEKYEKKIAKETGYSIVDHNLEIKGICPDCKKRHQTH